MHGRCCGTLISNRAQRADDSVSTHIGLSALGGTANKIKEEFAMLKNHATTHELYPLKDHQTGQANATLFAWLLFLFGIAIYLTR
jgi:hypothetical protein